MKKVKLVVILISLLLINTQNVFSQTQIAKSWEGSLTVMGKTVRVIFNISADNKGNLKATIDSPDQGAKGIPVDNVTFENSKLRLESNTIGGIYEGTALNDFSQIEGEWKQAGQAMPLILKPAAEEEKINYVSFWQGKLKVGNNELKINLKFFKSGKDSLGAFLDSPDQGAMNIQASKVHYSADSVYVEINRVGGFYKGELADNKTRISGNWTQGSYTLPLVLDRVESIEEQKRPQTPKKPFPYKEEEVTFENKEAGVTLAGTLTYPEGVSKTVPVVILVSGSGPQNRDEELFGHKPFLVWADHLTRNGIAVLRYDDRGTNKSTGNFSDATTEDFTSDAIAAVKYLLTRKEVDHSKIGIMGHSEGGAIAPIAANKCKDISFIVLGAGPAVTGDEIILMQLEGLSCASGTPEEQVIKESELNKLHIAAVKNTSDIDETTNKLDKIYEDYYNSLPDSIKIKPETKAMLDQKKKGFTGKWMRYFLKYDPRTELVKLEIPVLALFGEKDVQVSPAQNKDEMEKALRNNRSKHTKVVVLKNLNHLFQECEKGTGDEYGKIEQTTSPQMLEVMTDWIKQVTN